MSVSRRSRLRTRRRWTKNSPWRERPARPLKSWTAKTRWTPFSSSPAPAESRSFSLGTAAAPAGGPESGATRWTNSFASLKEWTCACSRNSMDDRGRGRLKIYMGYAAGVGKTYQMLEEVHQLKDRGADVVVGYFESHGRKDTIAMTE